MVKPVQRFQASDGKLFENIAEAELYEEHPDAHALVGKTAEEMRGVMEGHDPDFALRIERLGYKLRRERQERERAEVERQARVSTPRMIEAPADADADS